MMMFSRMNTSSVFFIVGLSMLQQAALSAQRGSHLAERLVRERRRLAPKRPLSIDPDARPTKRLKRSYEFSPRGQTTFAYYNSVKQQEKELEYWNQLKQEKTLEIVKAIDDGEDKYLQEALYNSYGDSHKDFSDVISQEEQRLLNISEVPNSPVESQKNRQNEEYRKHVLELHAHKDSLAKIVPTANTVKEQIMEEAKQKVHEVMEESKQKVRPFMKAIEEAKQQIHAVMEESKQKVLPFMEALEEAKQKVHTIKKKMDDITLKALKRTKKAILFGVSQYQIENSRIFEYGQLQAKIFAENDLNEIEKTLKEEGWVVEKHLNLTADGMRTAFRKWVATIVEGTECFFQFSGHGNYTKAEMPIGENQYVENVSCERGNRWMLAADARRSGESLENFIPVDEFQRQLNSVNQTGYKMFVMDCCANSPGFMGKVEKRTPYTGFDNTYLLGYNGKLGHKAGAQVSTNVGYLTLAVQDIFEEKESICFSDFGETVQKQARTLPGFKPTKEIVDCFLKDAQLGNPNATYDSVERTLMAMGFPGDIVGEKSSQFSRSNTMYL